MPPAAVAIAAGKIQERMSQFRQTAALASKTVYKQLGCQNAVDDVAE
jgi:hypothetical protein